MFRPQLLREFGAQVPFAAEADVEHLTKNLLKDALRERATDIHLEPERYGCRIRLRIDGVLFDAFRLGSDQQHRLLNQIRSMAGLDPGSAFQPRQGRQTYELSGRPIDMRITTIPCLTGEKIVVRLLDPERVQHRIERLGLNEVKLSTLQEWITDSTGMFLVTGPTGAGKTTTLYTLLRELNAAHRSVVSIEDPVEYELPGITQIQVDERHGLTFAAGLRAMLRLDPDLLLMGEIRDNDSARVAVDAAESGRVLLATMHSPDAVAAIAALRGWGVLDHEIASTLQVVVAQRLVRTLCEHCGRLEAPTDDERMWLQSARLATPEAVGRAVGCEHCLGVGYTGRTGVFELWRLEDDDCQRILEHASERELWHALTARGHGSLLSNGMIKVAAGLTTLEELRANVGMPGSRRTGNPAQHSAAATESTAG